MDDNVKTPSEDGRVLNTTYSATNPLVNNDSSFPDGIDSGFKIREELPPPVTNVPPHVQKTSIGQTTKLYRRRWYILLLYSLMCGMQGLVWNTWSPISNSVEKAFGWNDGDISLLVNWGPITCMSMPIFAWMLDTKGLRWSVITSMFFITLGSGVRCIPTQQPSTLHKWLINIGQILNGLGGPVSTGAMPVVSATWFPPRERTTATAIPVVVNYSAIAASFIFGPLLVPDVSKPNGTEWNMTTYRYGNDSGKNDNNISGLTVEDLKKDITFYLQLDAAIAGALFLLMLVYFPKKPPTPPCVSASVEREHFSQGLKELIRIGNFWLMVLVTALAIGFSNAWMAVLSLVLIPIGVSQKEAGWIGFYSLLSVGGFMLITGRVGDYFARHMKWFIASLYVVAGAMYLWFALICIKILPFSTAYLYVTVIIGQVATVAPTPLLFELACDLAYPVGEGTSSGVLTGATFAISTLFLFIMMIPNIGTGGGTMWLTWSVMSAMILSTVLVAIVREKHQRLEIDVIVEKDKIDQ